MNSHSHFNGEILKKTGDSHPEDLVKKYPWCSVVQLSLLSSYKKNNSPHFEKQASIAALFFNNLGWLNWQLQQINEEVEVKQNEPLEIPAMAVGEELQNEKIQQSLADISSQANTSEEVIAFEPLHTTDYFASQGIKLTDEPVSNDKLGTQVKSFTEWLKSMKKIHKADLAAGDEQTDKTIQRIAESSNAAAEVFTEAMADVLIKQDKIEKAIEVYEKLSLINPSKSAYFAAKIDRLKTS